jgi:hypothetical protein
MPGVVSATIMDRVPFYVGFPAHLEVSVDGRSCAIETCPTAASYHVGPDYFRTMNIPLRRGRALDGSPADAQAVVVSETMARNFWPSSDPLGQRISLGADGRRLEVVGIAADTVHRIVGERPEPYVYLPFESYGYTHPFGIVLRTAGDSEPLLRIVADEMRAMDASLPIYRLRTMQQRIDARQQSGNLMVLRFFAVCGGLALFLSIVGLAGTVSYSVGQRIREFGVRAAMGASPADQAKLVLSGALTMAGPGIALGLFGALLLSWLVASRVASLDLNSPVTYLVVAVLQLAIALVAAAIPGRRAARASPLAALRVE